jgi:hypothetical protein
METTIINRAGVHDKIRGKISSGNVCYYSLQKLLSICLLLRSEF